MLLHVALKTNTCGMRSQRVLKWEKRPLYVVRACKSARVCPYARYRSNIHATRRSVCIRVHARLHTIWLSAITHRVATHEGALPKLFLSLLRTALERGAAEMDLSHQPCAHRVRVSHTRTPLACTRYSYTRIVCASERVYTREL